MKCCVRWNVFETNSSSVHAITYGDYDGEKIPGGTVVFSGDEFGWYGNGTGACYLYTAIRELFQNDEEEYVWWKQYISDSLQEYAGMNAEFIEENFDGYIDHVYELRPMLNTFRESPETMVSFVISGWVECGNDNGAEPDYADADFVKWN